MYVGTTPATDTYRRTSIPHGPPGRAAGAGAAFRLVFRAPVRCFRRFASTLSARAPRERVLETGGLTVSVRTGAFVVWDHVRDCRRARANCGKRTRTRRTRRRSRTRRTRRRTTTMTMRTTTTTTTMTAATIRTMRMSGYAHTGARAALAARGRRRGDPRLARRRCGADDRRAAATSADSL